MPNLSMYHLISLQLHLLSDNMSRDKTCSHHLSLHLSDDRKEASRPKKKFLAADVRKMHDILSKNMYKIRQKVIFVHAAAISISFVK